MKIGELLQYYVLNTVINFLFKNFIALWRHLAKTQLLCDAQIYLYNVNKRFRKVAPQRDEIFKQKVNDCVECSAYNIAEVHQFPRNSVMEFQNICNEMVAPFFAPPCIHRESKNIPVIISLSLLKHCPILIIFCRHIPKKIWLEAVI